MIIILNPHGCLSACLSSCINTCVRECVYLYKQKKKKKIKKKQAYLSQDVIEDIKNPFHQKFMSRLLPVICSVGFCHAILTPVIPFKIIGEKGSYLLKSSETVSCIDLNDLKKYPFT